MTTKIYRRCGTRISRKAAQEWQAKAADFYRSGKRFDPAANPRPDIAARIEQMTIEEFAQWSGEFSVIKTD